MAANQNQPVLGSTNPAENPYAEEQAFYDQWKKEEEMKLQAA